MRALLMLSLVACAPKVAPTGAPPQALTSAPAVSDVPVWWGGDAPAPEARIVARPAHAGSPALEGDRMALDLKSLARTQLDYTLHMETGALATVSEADQRLLLTHLAADPRWRVAEVDGVLAATRREQGANGWTIPASGYHRASTGPWRVLLRFGAWPSDHPWNRSEFVGRAKADAASATVRGFLPPDEIWQGNVTTALTVDAGRLALDVYEMGPEADREHTRWALGELPSMLHNVRMMRNSLSSVGHEPILLPRGEPVSGPPSVEVRAAGAGEIEVRARINPGQAGWTWVRLVRDDRPVEELAMVAATRERIGWSPSADKQFYAQSRVPIASGPAFAARAEVWFQADGGPPVRLHAQPVQVPAR